MLGYLLLKGVKDGSQDCCGGYFAHPVPSGHTCDIADITPPPYNYGATRLELGS